jgi:hypothetical protein
MTIPMHALSVAQMAQMLGSLSALIDKAEAYASARKVDPAVLLASRLALDMFPLSRQIQLATDFAKGPCARLAGLEVPSYPDTEATTAELKARIGRTVDFIKGIKPEAFIGAESRDITIKVGGNPVTLKGQPYLIHFALPNFYFHLTTAYAIMRHNGVELGKRDFMGKVPGLA